MALFARVGNATGKTEEYLRDSFGSTRAKNILRYQLFKVVEDRGSSIFPFKTRIEGYDYFFKREELFLYKSKLVEVLYADD